MPVNKNFALRLEVLDACLRNHLKSWDIDSLVEEVNNRLLEYGFSASKRSVQADLKFLQDNYQAPIERKRKGNKNIIRYSDPHYSIKNLPVSAEEIELLKDAINILNQVSDFKLVDEVAEIVNKLQHSISNRHEATQAYIQFERQPLTRGSEYIDNLFTAIKAKSTLRIKYQPFYSGEASEFIFYPYLLKEVRNRWYVIGRRQGYDFPITYSLDRIISLKNSKEPFMPNDLFNPETLFENLIGVTIPKNRKVEDIAIRVKKATVPYFLTKPFHHSQHQLQTYANGDVCFGFRLIINRDLISQILAFGASVKVLKPVVLKNEIEMVLKEALNQYKK